MSHVTTFGTWIFFLRNILFWSTSEKK